MIATFTQKLCESHWASLVCEIVDLTSVLLSLEHVACVVCLFSDESRFTLFRPDGRRHVYRSRGERFSDACVLERDMFGDPSLMVWGGIYHGLKSPSIVIAGNLIGVIYRDEILWPVAVLFVRQDHLIFPQDYARFHVARVCQDVLANHNINPLDWPQHNLDLSPVEHLRDELVRRVRGRRNVLLLSTN